MARPLSGSGPVGRTNATQCHSMPWPKPSDVIPPRNLEGPFFRKVTQGVFLFPNPKVLPTGAAFWTGFRSCLIGCWFQTNPTPGGAQQLKMHQEAERLKGTASEAAAPVHRARLRPRGPPVRSSPTRAVDRSRLEGSKPSPEASKVKRLSNSSNHRSAWTAPGGRTGGGDPVRRGGSSRVPAPINGTRTARSSEMKQLLSFTT